VAGRSLRTGFLGNAFRYLTLASDRDSLEGGLILVENKLRPRASRLGGNRRALARQLVER
jgi:hypothetical protein